MNNYPQFSIVTPSFNQGAFLTEMLLSVSNQSPFLLEQIVMDGGSRDGTVEVLRQQSASGRTDLQWVSEPDRGQSHALNKGFVRARGDIVGWLNSDDRYRPGCLEAVAGAFGEDPTVDVIYGDYAWIDEQGRLMQVRREIEFSRFVLLYHRVLYIPTTATFFRRRVFEEGNFLNENLHFAMDYEFFLRLAFRGYRLRHLPVLLADFRFHAQSKSRTMPDKQLQEQNMVMQQYSSILRNCQSSLSRKAALIALRTAAAALRYSEKAVRGYYFDRLRSHAT